MKALVEKIDHGRDEFEGALDNELKHTVIKSATGEMDVKRTLDDFDDSMDWLKDRLKPESSASSEAAAMLGRATALDAFLKQQPPGLKGTSEWTRLAADLKTLAVAYGADFPLAEHAPVRRITDRELATAAEQLAKAGEQLKKSLDADLKMDTSVPARTGRRRSPTPTSGRRTRRAQGARQGRQTELSRGGAGRGWPRS